MSPDASRALGQEVIVRVATFNLQDVSTAEILAGDTPRLKHLAEIIQRVRPNVILLNEIAYDMPGAPDVPRGPGQTPGQNGQRFADIYLSHPQTEGGRGLKFKSFMASTNTGVPSGMDLDRNGQVVTVYTPPPKRAPGDAISEAGREYGNDCWGFGTYPGQFGMALLVDERLTILADQARTFQLLPWDYIPGAFIPLEPDGRTSWYSTAVLETLRLSSKSHWDVPVKLPNGAVIHFLCSHPTPPVFDGPERRNARRNHDEIRFWADYIEDASYVVDDANQPGGLAPDAHFVILGDLNADPDEGSSFKDPIGTVLGSVRRIQKLDAPTSDRAIEGLDPDDTAMFKLRVDYVLPSAGLRAVRSGVWRSPASGEQAAFPSDHFPVWMEVAVPSP
ncbi:MAG: endonuclease/exonuclease/phosphatase family protein [Planctomycetota bacterium]|nr:endonuclease/exonuclease/phosphatase family protein [Planctomycetota bacterium]